MTERPIVYIKGYELDLDKIRSQFPREDYHPTASNKSIRSVPIINHIPKIAYKYVGCGLDPDGHLHIVLVLEDAYERQGRIGGCYCTSRHASVLTPGMVGRSECMA
ncbi:hypothetical protein BYT27DRAFT_7166780 [Phlegmacium glaucopus]|nr:hypothetical protein BYT27DRAFT_7166780 [Phlegmacium glaucopus]